MKLFSAGATRPAADTAWASAANDLVQRTLAQHGLASPVEQSAQIGGVNPPSINSMLAKLSGQPMRSASPETSVPDGAIFTDDIFACASGSRRYRLYVPASTSEGATGVVMMLHGCTQTPEDFANGTGMNTLADRHGFVVVYPAQSRGDNAQSCWNWFSRGDQRRGRGEPAILAGLAQKICADYGVTRDDTFVAGLSAGAAMAVILGETYPDVFAAVGAHSGLPAGSAKDVPSAFAAMAGNALEATEPVQADQRVRTILFHGSADHTVHPSNGHNIARRARSAGPGQSVETSTTGNATGRTYTRDMSSDEDGTALVEHWTVEGQGHAWSGGQPGGSYTDPNGPDASAEMIRFFFGRTDKDT
ncbi:PHB depolymerase family esterase [Aestuariivita sp.]|jgi:poly(hydroxyalkanoate) depolymerase family esterase|uniref:extracellular catalytic domain type 1 short-chain-length polyhydroxyalkanoate depolymerase n=1 Tax=Aestuariivita sp. TaxID=1872407 RepID=UPI00216EC4FF|nr:PHB depolymerase family esterase [Aestuariivita sp.]MCE8005797.1 PHB depolymerase family esterase [Aestuariivita sp.]